MDIVKYTFLDIGDAVLEYEPIGDVLVLHCTVRNWKPSVLKLMKGVFELFVQDAKDQGYKKLVTFTPNPKFCKLFGGKYKDHMVVNDQYIEVYEWVLKQP